VPTVFPILPTRQKAASMSRAKDDAAPADESGPIIAIASSKGSGEDAELVHLTTILSTLVGAHLGEDMGRMDGTTSTAAPEHESDRARPNTPRVVAAE
jgi:hypothetical protein